MKILGKRWRHNTNSSRPKHSPGNEKVEPRPEGDVVARQSAAKQISSRLCLACGSGTKSSVYTVADRALVARRAVLRHKVETLSPCHTRHLGRPKLHCCDCFVKRKLFDVGRSEPCSCFLVGAELVDRLDSRGRRSCAKLGLNRRTDHGARRTWVASAPSPLPLSPLLVWEVKFRHLKFKRSFFVPALGHGIDLEYHIKGSRVTDLKKGCTLK